MTTRRRCQGRRVGAFVLALALITAACGGGGQTTDGETEAADDGATSAETEDAGASDAEEPAVTDEEPVEINLVTPLPQETLEFEGGWIFIEQLEESAPWITVNYLGGAEVMAGNDQIEGLSNGAFDMAFLVPGYLGGLIPGAPAMLLSPNHTVTDEREAGTIDAYNELFFEPVGIKYLGDTQSDVQFTIWLGPSGADIDPADPEFFKGMTIRGTTQYSAVVEPRGGSMVNMPFGEVYTSMERGVIDGYGGPSVGIFELGTTDVTNYELRPHFKKNVVGVGANQQWWDGLSDGTREAIEAAMLASEPLITEHYASRVAEAQAQFEELGIEVIELTGEAAESWERDALEGGWAEIKEFDPAAFEALQNLWYGGIEYGDS